MDARNAAKTFYIIGPRNSSKYIGVIRVPQRAALLPRLVQSKKDMISFNKWVRK